MFSVRDGKKLRKTFPSLTAAKAWRHDASTSVRKGTLRAATSITLREAADAWLAGARDGSIRTRSGDPYKPSVIRSYDQALRLRVLDDLGSARLVDVRRPDVQALADRLLAQGLDPSTIRNALMPLRVIYRRSVEDGDLAVSPCSSLRLPAVRGRRDRIASPAEAAALLDALPEDDRALWATALYAGLRRGELMALRWEDIDLAVGVIHVSRSYDPTSGTIVTPKSTAGVRRVPIAAVLRAYLAAHRLRCDWSDGLAFGKTAGTPRSDGSIRKRAERAWRDAGLDRLRAARGAAHVRVTDDRRGSEREGALHLYGALVDHDHARPLRAPDAGERGAGCWTARRLPTGVGQILRVCGAALRPPLV